MKNYKDYIEELRNSLVHNQEAAFKVKQDKSRLEEQVVKAGKEILAWEEYIKELKSQLQQQTNKTNLLWVQKKKMLDNLMIHTSQWVQR